MIFSSVVDKINTSYDVFKIKELPVVMTIVNRVVKTASITCTQNTG